MTAMDELREGLIQNWLRARDGVIAQVEKLSEEQLCWLPGPGARTGLQIARHIADASSNLAENAARGTRSTRNAAPDEVLTREDVVARLKAGRAVIEGHLRAITDEQLLQKVPALMGGETTRFGFLTFGYAHEMYHWGQLGLCARAGGEIPELTRSIEARRKATVT
jgi:uncharacterized damage-inducible protein DinB